MGTITYTYKNCSRCGYTLWSNSDLGDIMFDSAYIVCPKCNSHLNINKSELIKLIGYSWSRPAYGALKGIFIKTFIFVLPIIFIIIANLMSHKFKTSIDKIGFILFFSVMLFYPLGMVLSYFCSLLFGWIIAKKILKGNSDNFITYVKERYSELKK